MGPVLLFDSVFCVLILSFGCTGAGVCGGGVVFGGGVGGGVGGFVGFGVGVGGGVGGGVGIRSTVTFCGVSSSVCVCSNLMNGPTIACSRIESAKPYARKFVARWALEAGAFGGWFWAI